MEMDHLSPERTPTRSEKDRVLHETSLLPEIILTEKLDSGDLNELRQYFYPPAKDHARLCHDMGFQKELGLGVPLTKESFAKAFFDIIGNKEYEIAARKLFDKLTEEGQLTDGCIWWDDFLEVITRGSAEAQLIGVPPSKRIKGKRNALICPCKSPVVRVLRLETPHSACYAVVSKLGNVGIYDQHFELKVKYEIPMGRFKTANCCWVTDAVYAAEANGVIVASSTRNLYFYNAEAELTIGDDKGDITSIHFNQPHKSFFQPQPDREATYYFWLQVKTQKQWVDIETKKKVHCREVNMVEFFPENKSIVSCSNDPCASLVMRHKNGKQSSYGVKRFHMDKRLGLLITVSGDYSIRLWNPVVTKGPIEELEGHGAPVIDIAILKHVRCIISFSEDAVMKVWDLESHSCVQTLHLNFPHCGLLMDFHRNLYPGLRQAAVIEESCTKEQPKVETSWDKTSDDTIPTPFRKDPWLRSEVIVVMGKYLKVLELESLFGQSVEPLPLPRRNLEPAIPTPYYPLTHTFRENTKSLKQKMFKNLAGLAPFHDSTSLSSFDLKQEYEEGVEVSKTYNYVCGLWDIYMLEYWI
ncbi:hypothetical protein GE061_000792 [Apolygus lucorum]|uniref:WD repeat-containing protein on Y chromosome n=1 Tax=Apolygus lucorum TaxID=248454 RepID=A0A8S9Y5A1_APOLU|nr:hypothetical protein GE061_000792 [Apolygus lucorum]